MKYTMWKQGVNPVVIPNGIPGHYLEQVDTASAASLRERIGADVVLTKVARWDPDKRWNTTVEAMASGADGIRRAARNTARRFTWWRVLENIFHELAYQARIRYVPR
jgi:hypothetical protein